MDKQSIYEDIKLQIIDERLSPGQWLVERELCASYDTSRTPIREILWKLLADGFLEQEANKGFMVRRLNLEQIFEVFQTREAIEGMAARLACQRSDERFRQTLLSIKEELAQVEVENDVPRSIMLGRKLHNAVIETAHNSMMSDIYQKLKNLTILTSNLTRKSSTIEVLSKGAHVDIIDALLARDEERSERVMRIHLKDTCKQVVDQFYPGMLNGFGK